MKRIRVLIVEDSAVVREHLRRVISADPRLEVAGLAASAEEALQSIDQIAPDVISMDIRLPGMQGLEATRRIMAHRPTPIVVVSAIESEEMNLTMEALKAGALSVVEKPVAVTHVDYESLAARLCTQLAIMSEVKVVRQRLIPPVTPDRLHTNAGDARGPFRVLGIVASTGGPSALMELLGNLGGGFPLPVVVVQHMTPTFVEGFRSWLASVVPFTVKLVTDRAPLVPATVYLASPDSHVKVDRVSAWSDTTAPVSNQRPSGTVLFSSMARSFGNSGLGVLLTGMGDDGAEGLLEMRRAGGYTLAEHESTAVVYGMPGVGVRLGAACESLPLPDIAPRILEMVGTKREAL